jgi:aspartate/methionine/tyrosine aminotransferase
MTDEIYQHLVYGEAEFSSLPALVPAAQERTIIVSGVAKTYAMTGWRVGWMVGPVDIIKGATNLQSHMTSNVANVSQAAALAALTGPQDIVGEMRTAFDRRRHLIVDLLNNTNGVTCPTPEGAFYAYPSVKGLLGKTLRGRTIDSSLTVAEVALEEALVAIVPGEAFGTPGYLRLSYATSDENIAEGIARLQKLFAEAE